MVAFCNVAVNFSRKLRFLTLTPRSEAPFLGRYWRELPRGGGASLELLVVFGEGPVPAAAGTVFLAGTEGVESAKCVADEFLGIAVAFGFAEDLVGLDGATGQGVAEPIGGIAVVFVGGDAADIEFGGDIGGLLIPDDGGGLLVLAASNGACQGGRELGDGVFDGEEEAAVGGIGGGYEGPGGASGAG